MKPPELNQRGFTLIEVIVVFSIIAILSLIGVAAFVKYSQIQTVETAASQLSSYLVIAKSRAISQVKPTSQVPQCDINSILNGYKVIVCPTSSSDVLCSSANTYVLAVRCSLVDYRVQTGTLPKNVTYSPDPTSISYLYPVITSGVKFDTLSLRSGTIYLTGYGFLKTITVDSVGGIQVQ